MTNLSQLQKKLDRIADDVESISTALNEIEEIEDDAVSVAVLAERVRLLASQVEAHRTKIEQRVDQSNDHTSDLERLGLTLESVQVDLEIVVSELEGFE
jgi:chromosome segregation ATPase